MARKRILLASLQPGVKVGHVTILKLVPTNCHDSARKFTVLGVCDCRTEKHGYVREYLEALWYEEQCKENPALLPKPLMCRSCTGKRSASSRWGQKKGEIPLEVQELAQRMFNDHRRAAQKLGIDPDDPANEIASHWREFVGDAHDIIKTLSLG